MSMTDPISEMLSQIRNAQAVDKTEVIVSYSKVKAAIAKILKDQNYLQAVEKISNGFDQLKLTLYYNQEGQGAIESIKRVSKPGRRVYSDSRHIPRILNGFGIAILSTPKGIMTGDQAKKLKVGGEVICEIY